MTLPWRPSQVTQIVALILIKRATAPASPGSVLTTCLLITPHPHPHPEEGHIVNMPSVLRVSLYADPNYR